MIPVTYKTYTNVCRTPIQLISTFNKIKNADRNSYQTALIAFLAIGYIPNNDAVIWHNRMTLFNDHK